MSLRSSAPLASFAQHYLKSDLEVLSFLKTMKLVSSKYTLIQLNNRLSQGSLPFLSKDDGSVTFVISPPRQAQPTSGTRQFQPLDSDDDEYDDENDYEDEDDNDSIEDDKFRKLMRVQSFGEMPKEMENTFDNIISGGKNQKPSISPIHGPPVSTFLENKDSQDSAKKRGRPRRRSRENVDAGQSRDNGDYTPSWSSPSNRAPSTMSNALPPKFSPPTVSTRIGENVRVA